MFPSEVTVRSLSALEIKDYAFFGALFCAKGMQETEENHKESKNRMNSVLHYLQKIKNY